MHGKCSTDCRVDRRQAVSPSHSSPSSSSFSSPSSSLTVVRFRRHAPLNKIRANYSLGATSSLLSGRLHSSVESLHRRALRSSLSALLLFQRVCPLARHPLPPDLSISLSLYDYPTVFRVPSYFPAHLVISACLSPVHSFDSSSFCHSRPFFSTLFSYIYCRSLPTTLFAAR